MLGSVLARGSGTDNTDANAMRRCLPIATYWARRRLIYATTPWPRFMPGLPVLTAVCLLKDRAPFGTVFDTYALDTVLTTFRRIEPLFYEQTDAREKALRDGPRERLTNVDFTYTNGQCSEVADARGAGSIHVHHSFESDVHVGRAVGEWCSRARRKGGDMTHKQHWHAIELEPPSALDSKKARMFEDMRAADWSSSEKREIGRECWGAECGLCIEGRVSAERKEGEGFIVMT
ncbi:hypothetical protein V8E53_013865 [Lactarius tabidus]